MKNILAVPIPLDSILENKLNSNDIRIKKIDGIYKVLYYRLWDSVANWRYPNHKNNVIKALAYCEKLNGTSQ